LPCGGPSYCQRCHSQWARFEEDVDDVIPIAVRAVGTELVDPEEGDLHPEVTDVISYTVEELCEFQTEDKDLIPVIDWLKNGEPSQADLFIEGPVTKQLWRCKSQLKLQSGILYYSWDYGTHVRMKLVVPEVLKQRVISMVHDTRSGGHFGRDKTIQRAKHSFFWVGMNRDI